ncbi:MAG TPA: 2-hydroxychromene-2-carboxylate isomerase [Burkholderiales bacterium]|nr:2-hydroxychromene-2-carboxylate isomerase [Burkholderiales bacterium]
MKTIDYYLHPASPWTYLGHERFAAIAKRHGAAIQVKPVDFGVIFPQSGGLPLPKRAPQRQAYRLVELRRWKEYLGIPLVIQPKHFPVNGNPAAALICAAPEEKRMALAGELLAALWRDDRNLADPALLAEIGARYGVNEGDVGAFERYTQEALERGVFGAPSYVYRDEILWGQDRLEFLDRALAK